MCGRWRPRSRAGHVSRRGGAPLQARDADPPTRGTRRHVATSLNTRSPDHDAKRLLDKELAEAEIVEEAFTFHDARCTKNGEFLPGWRHREAVQLRGDAGRMGLVEEE
jgi:hypothetical protein